MLLKTTLGLLLSVIITTAANSQQIQFEKDTLTFTRDRVDNVEKRINIRIVDESSVAPSNIALTFASTSPLANPLPARIIAAGSNSTSFYFRVGHGTTNDTVKIYMSYISGSDSLVIILKAPAAAIPSTASAATGTSGAPANGAAQNEANKPAKPDTIRFNDNFSYNDTEIFNLKLIKYVDKTEMKVCKIPDTLEGNCVSKTVLGDIKRETFSKFAKQMVASLLGVASVDSSKFDPLAEDEYVNYTTFLAKQKPKEPTENEKQIAAINKKLEDLFNEASNKKKIGYFKLVNPKVIVRKKEGKDALKNPASETSANIESVEIVLYNGAIRKNGIKVLLDDGRVFRNKFSPITLYRFDKMKGEPLYVDDKREGKYGYYIELGDVFNYVYNGKFSYPSDRVLNLTPDKPVDSLFVESTIGELLDVNIFSDLLALVGRKPNGIIQTQVTGTFITNTNRVRRNHDIVLNNFMKAYFKLSKYDSKFGQLDSANNKRDNIDSVVNRLYLNQIAYLQAGIKANVFRMGLGNNQQIMLNVGAEISLTNADSIYKKDLITINYYPEFEYVVNRLDNFGLEASIKYLYQFAAKNSPYKNRDRICIFNPQVTIYYYPFSNPNNKIYVRYAHFAQIGDGKYNYPQFQFGFKTNLFGKKEKSD